MSYVKQAAKAVYAGLVTGLASLGALLVNDTSFGDITAGQWVYVAGAALIAAGGVYRLGPRVVAPAGGGD